MQYVQISGSTQQQQQNANKDAHQWRRPLDTRGRSKIRKSVAIDWYPAVACVAFPALGSRYFCSARSGK